MWRVVLIQLRHLGSEFLQIVRELFDCAALCVPIPTPDQVFLDAEETMRFVQALEAPPKLTTPAQAAAVQLYRQTVKEL